jgi:hypothetical protein
VRASRLFPSNGTTNCSNYHVAQIFCNEEKYSFSPFKTNWLLFALFKDETVAEVKCSLLILGTKGNQLLKEEFDVGAIF